MPIYNVSFYNSRKLQNCKYLHKSAHYRNTWKSSIISESHANLTIFFQVLYWGFKGPEFDEIALSICHALDSTSEERLFPN